MLNFILRCKNPFGVSNKKEDSKDFLVLDRPLPFKNKNLDIQISKFPAYDLFELELDLIWWGADHAGPRISIDLFGYHFHIGVYDSRHWNYDTSAWYTDEEWKRALYE